MAVVFRAQGRRDDSVLLAPPLCPLDTLSFLQVLRMRGPSVFLPECETEVGVLEPVALDLRPWWLSFMLKAVGMIRSGLRLPFCPLGTSSGFPRSFIISGAFVSLPECETDTGFLSPLSHTV
jgi:hypothetical protein